MTTGRATRQINANKTDAGKSKRGQELIIDTINTAFGTPFERHHVQIKQHIGEKLAHPNGV